MIYLSINMNKKGISLPIEKIIVLLIGLIVIIALLFYTRNSVSTLTDFFLKFIKDIFIKDIFK